MGVFTIECPSCKQLHDWFSGSTDQRCYHCKYIDRKFSEGLSNTPGVEAMALSIKFQIGARVAHKYGGPATVIGGPFKGGDGVTHLPVKFDNPRMGDGASGYHESYFALIEPKISFSDWALNPRTVGLMKRCDSFEKQSQVMRGAGLTLQRELDARNEQLLKLEQRVGELEQTVKVSAKFIELQTNRLINARKHITRIRVHCDLPEPGDSGEGLDP